MSGKTSRATKATSVTHLYAAIVLLIAIAVSGWYRALSPTAVSTPPPTTKVAVDPYEALMSRSGAHPMTDYLYRRHETLRQSLLLSEDPQTADELQVSFGFLLAAVFVCSVLFSILPV